MDRIAPTRRPEGPNAGTQSWRELLFVHWEVPEELLRPLVPARLSIDTWDGRAMVGMVPFAMRNIRPRWLPRVLAQDFLETNLRTYVHLDGEEPGVWFFSLEASSWSAVMAARLGWSLPYHHARMSMRHEGERIDYETVRRSDGARMVASWTPGAVLGASTPGTVEFWLLERYVLYSERRGRLYRGRVHHPAYRAREAELHLGMEETLTRAAGVSERSAEPVFVHACDGVDVEMFGIVEV
ncbi:YqjF family protein [Paraliomyxa miuraensis]|uniref:YqjF family protein n=1 Tax=Paraliomyxa miuraensis TaxID=376150 RepID=UPI002250D0D2|nr:DUF2071 domain-containing protein [Paraliomyxa miuraensis]MCX4242959.1 DUF2071 domain-containing protein [Paraliomyxa miuraensis]